MKNILEKLNGLCYQSVEVECALKMLSFSIDSITNYNSLEDVQMYLQQAMESVNLLFRVQSGIAGDMWALHDELDSVLRNQEHEELEPGKVVKIVR